MPVSVITCKVNLPYFTNYNTASVLILLSIDQDHMKTEQCLFITGDFTV